MRKSLLILALLASGCATAGSHETLCSATASESDDLAAALLVDGGDLSVEAGAALLVELDAGCGRR